MRTARPAVNNFKIKKFLAWLVTQRNYVKEATDCQTENKKEKIRHLTILQPDAINLISAINAE